MKNTLRIQKLLYVLLLILPIIDNIYKFREDGSSPAVIVRAITTIIMLYILIRLNPLGQSSRHIVGTVLFLVVYIVVISFLFTQKSWVFYYLVKLSYPFVGFILIYYMTKHSLMDEKNFAVFYFIVIVILFINSYLNINHRLDSSRGLDVADNTGSAVMCAYAGVMLLSKRKVFPVVIFLSIVGVLISGKRGAVLGVALASIPLVKFLFTSYSRKIRQKVFLLTLAAISVYFAIQWFGGAFDATFGRFAKIEDDGGSGRNIMYLAYWSHFCDSDPLLQLFGHGLRSASFGSGSRYAFNSHAAHNDWLQLLFDFGIISVVAYAILFIKILLVAWNSRKNKDVYYYMLMMSVVLWLVKSATSSTFFMTPNSIYLYMTTAYSIAKLEQGQISIKSDKSFQFHDLQTTFS